MIEFLAKHFLLLLTKQQSVLLVLLRHLVDVLFLAVLLTITKRNTQAVSLGKWFSSPNCSIGITDWVTCCDMAYHWCCSSSFFISYWAWVPMLVVGQLADDCISHVGPFHHLSQLERVGSNPTARFSFSWQCLQSLGPVFSRTSVVRFATNGFH